MRSWNREGPIVVEIAMYIRLERTNPFSSCIQIIFYKKNSESYNTDELTVYEPVEVEAIFFSNISTFCQFSRLGTTLTFACSLGLSSRNVAHIMNGDEVGQLDL